MIALETTDGALVYAATYVRDGREWVRALSDWARVGDIDRLRAIHRGPATYGHVDYEVIPWEEWAK